ncbi:MAG: hypothetical protein CO103_01160 [Chloroflexi bacterium CG_4_9_14_3_um_filter_45_9]|nr:MAG: hypothetical protein AUK00_02015 [Dehalococcoidia bacterium CG2_30_46_9]PIU23092.1 MAG: hypothetical protein COT13_04980 [Chloroflexi bacterium CG08_land_8_20_14_0_20_45_12]PIX27213.1 MAG: hypothetical protein COZ67_03585 [Chloroflexi bacterium CG_4_8_14_3_um_filter_45_15]PJB50918.1 MAG: hypothetical protein CO103_01160 [Chloroflexi bacterium CG_4_9_14_3_um_filter_45_9]
MAKQEEKMIPVTIYLTPKQIREAYHQLVEEEKEEDWINAPEILEMLAKSEDAVAGEIKEGKFITLGELQTKLGK